MYVRLYVCLYVFMYLYMFHHVHCCLYTRLISAHSIIVLWMRVIAVYWSNLEGMIFKPKIDVDLFMYNNFERFKHNTRRTKTTLGFKNESPK